ncbi:hypothetical protein XELAEV_18022396mg [Xenopus laevis]|uniref:Uncharacterized protein n=1 Tax=Xenopus laevis TaxID=8355 RepID=A0A974D2B0_XENLA|nr:hypothetical protein XELAEV_18022396mg [Xenopus laevis]
MSLEHISKPTNHIWKGVNTVHYNSSIHKLIRANLVISKEDAPFGKCLINVFIGYRSLNTWCHITVLPVKCCGCLNF